MKLFEYYCFSFWKRFISCAGKAIQSSEMLNIIICFAFSALKQWRNSWLSGRLKSWNSADRGVRNNHTKPTIKPVYRLGKLAEFLDKSRWDDRKSNKTRWTKSTTRVLLSERPRVRAAVGAPESVMCVKHVALFSIRASCSLRFETARVAKRIEWF